MNTYQTATAIIQRIIVYCLIFPIFMEQGVRLSIIVYYCFTDYTPLFSIVLVIFFFDYKSTKHSSASLPSNTKPISFSNVTVSTFTISRTVYVFHCYVWIEHFIHKRFYIHVNIRFYNNRCKHESAVDTRTQKYYRTCTKTIYYTYMYTIYYCNKCPILYTVIRNVHVFHLTDG